MRCIVGINQKFFICYIICCFVSGIHGRELFSRNLRQQGHHYFEHIKTLKALFGLAYRRRLHDYIPCGGLIGCGLIDIAESGKRKRSSHDFDKLPMRKNIVNSRALLNQINQEQVSLDMTNKHSFYDKLTSYWNGKKITTEKRIREMQQSLFH